jgi:hypothetical protein
MSIVHADDRSIVDYLQDLVHYDDHCWIGGGTPLNWYLGRPCDSDIDLFFRGQPVFDKLNSKLNAHYEENHKSWIFTPNQKWAVTERLTTDNAVTYELTRQVSKGVTGRSYKVQLIKRAFYDSPQAALDDFDITVCQIVTDGKQLWTGNHFARDVAERRLRFHKLTPGSAKRLVKYWVYGYVPTQTEIAQINSSLDLNWKAALDDYA